jgi:hypothetical protein
MLSRKPPEPKSLLAKVALNTLCLGLRVFDLGLAVTAYASSLSILGDKVK